MTRSFFPNRIWNPFVPTFSQTHKNIKKNRTYLSIQIFSTCGTRTCSKRIIVCNGNFTRHDATHSGVGFQIGDIIGKLDGVTRMLPR